MSGVDKSAKRKLLCDGWVEVASSRTVETLRECGFPLRYVRVHSFQGAWFTRPWVMRLYVASTGRGRSFMTVEDALRRGLALDACEAAEALGGVEALVEMAQGFGACATAKRRSAASSAGDG